jgi:hypothetical protein
VGAVAPSRSAVPAKAAAAETPRFDPKATTRFRGPQPDPSNGSSWCPAVPGKQGFRVASFPPSETPGEQRFPDPGEGPKETS